MLCYGAKNNQNSNKNVFRDINLQYFQSGGMTTENKYEDLAMRVYWDCQDLQGRLAEVEEAGERRAVMMS